jgi:hypothetical protein
MEIYMQSTQKKNWIFDRQGITKLHLHKLQRVLAIIEEIKKTTDESGHPNKVNVRSTKPEEEKNLIIYFSSILLDALKRISSRSLKVTI